MFTNLTDVYIITAIKISFMALNSYIKNQVFDELLLITKQLLINHHSVALSFLNISLIITFCMFENTIQQMVTRKFSNGRNHVIMFFTINVYVYREF